jgi:adenylate cyclase
VDIVRVVGRAEPIRIFELVSLGAMTEEDWEEHATRYAEGLKAYRAQRWDEAERAFGAALATKPEDGPSAVMIERCKAFRQSPPDAGWDGVFALGEK